MKNGMDFSDWVYSISPWVTIIGSFLILLVWLSMLWNLPWR
jgi:hypothetical protein